MVKVSSIMIKNFPVMKEHESISDAIKVLIKIPESSLPVLNKDGDIIGELSQEDLLLKIIGKKEMTGDDLDFKDIQRLLSSKTTEIDDLIEKHTISANPNDDVEDYVKLMYDNEISTIPVIEKGKLVGILTDISILKHFKELCK